MSDQIISEEPGDESNVLKVSVRGWITLIVVATVCGMSIFAIEVKEPLYTMAGMCLGWYFGQKKIP